MMSLPMYYRGAGVLFAAPDNEGRWRVLLGQRRWRPFRSCWSIPGGGMEKADRDLKDCAARETVEETFPLGHSGVAMSALREHLDSAPQHHISIPFLFRWRTFLVAMMSIPPADFWPTRTQVWDEFSAWGWFKLDELPSPTHPCVRWTVKAFRRRSGGGSSTSCPQRESRRRSWGRG